MFITHRQKQLLLFSRRNYIFNVMSIHCIFCKVRSELYLCKYYLDILWLQEVKTDAFYSALKKDTEPDGRLRQCEGVTDFGTFLRIKLLVECHFDPTLLPTS